MRFTMIQMFAGITLVAIVFGVFHRPIMGVGDKSLVCDMGTCFAAPFYSFFWTAGGDDDNWPLRDVDTILNGYDGWNGARTGITILPCFIANLLGGATCVVCWGALGCFILILFSVTFNLPCCNGPPTHVDNDASLGGGH